MATKEGKTEKKGNEHPIFFEDAIDISGVGVFNVCLLVAFIPTTAAMVFASSTISYVLPTAECDLRLTVMKKGLINAITYAGMIISALPWGYVADIFGRKPVLVVGLLIDFAFVIGAAASQTSTQLFICKFFDGFIICGPFATAVAYISEFHSKKNRATVIMLSGLMVSLAALVLPVMAFFLLPVHNLQKLGILKFHNWNFFILYTAIPSLLGGIFHIFLPESPKFLMSQGRSEEALKVFKRVFAMNKRLPKDKYPYDSLYDEAPEKTAARLSSIAAKESVWRRAATKIKHGTNDFKIIFTREYLGACLLVCGIHVCISFVLNSVRLWLPQVFVTMAEMQANDMKATGMCSIIYYNVNKTKFIDHESNTCVDVHVSGSSYLNNIVVAGTCFTGYLIIVFTAKCINNNIISWFTISCGLVLTIIFYFSFSPLMTLIVASIYISVCGIAATSVISASISIFPTTIRTMVIIMIMTFGRLGSVVGNIIFPALFTIGCIPPFVALGFVLLIALILAVFLPNSSKADLL